MVTSQKNKKVSVILNNGETFEDVLIGSSGNKEWVFTERSILKRDVRSIRFIPHSQGGEKDETIFACPEPGLVRVGVRDFALVDKEDVPLVSEYSWNLDKDGYAISVTKGNAIRMHGLILGTKGGDHINHNPLDNRKTNLRPASVTENNRYRRKTANKKSSIFKGVCFLNTEGCWRSSVVVNGNTIPIHWESEKEAAICYNILAEQFHGEYFCHNGVVATDEEIRDMRERTKIALDKLMKFREKRAKK